MAYASAMTLSQTAQFPGRVYDPTNGQSVAEIRIDFNRDGTGEYFVEHGGEWHRVGSAKAVGKQRLQVCGPDGRGEEKCETLEFEERGKPADGRGPP